ncbi:GTP-binding nuclear protein gsp1/Ran [Mortierella sp. AD094]|nr:GTP-binding nuclear protein gsp1/Ran [Mortierella sp. AD094]
MSEEYLEKYSGPAYKIVLVGDSKVGKTEFVRLFEHGAVGLDKSTGAYIYPIRFQLLDGYINYEVWDMDETIPDGSGNPEDFYKGAHGAFLMFDVRSPNTYDSIADWDEELIQTAGEIPVVLCGNMVDAIPRRVFASDIEYQLKRKDCEYIDISCKSNYHVVAAFRRMGPLVTRRSTALINPEPNIMKPDIEINYERMARYESDENFVAVSREWQKRHGKPNSQQE